jgi:hypothetical protein
LRFSAFLNVGAYCNTPLPARAPYLINLFKLPKTKFADQLYRNLLIFTGRNNISMEKNRQFNITLLAIAFIVVGGILRMVFTGRFPNFSPVYAMALFAGVYFADKRLAFILPVLIMLLTDVALEVIYQAGWHGQPGFHKNMPFVYIGFLLTVFIGTFLKNNVKPLPLAGAGLLSAIAFFIVSNFGVWINNGDLTYSAFVKCFADAIPFFHYTLSATLLFGAVFFGAFEYIKYKYYKPAPVVR